MVKNAKVNPRQIISISSSPKAKQELETVLGKEIGGGYNLKTALSVLPKSGSFFNELKKVVDHVIETLPKKK